MKMDKFTKVMITIIAIGLIGINYNLFKDSMVKKVEASNKLDWKVVSDNDHIFIIANNGVDSIASTKIGPVILFIGYCIIIPISIIYKPKK